MVKKIKSLKELKLKSSNRLGEFVEFFILLNGILRSSKSIRYNPKSKTFDIINEIDWTNQFDLTEEQLKSQTLIFEAIEKGAFFMY